MSCDICTENFNKSTRKQVICLYCNQKSCATCTKTFILEHAGKPKCFNCNREWNREFLYNFITKSFVTTDYKTQREKILLDYEKS